MKITNYDFAQAKGKFLFSGLTPFMEAFYLEFRKRGLAGLPLRVAGESRRLPSWLPVSAERKNEKVRRDNLPYW